MRSLSEIPDSAIAKIDVVLFDIDDTLTTHGVLTANAYAALHRLREAGKRVIPITGRPAGWCDHIARMWPVDAVVGENGAFYFYYDRAAKKLTQRFLADAAQRAEAKARMNKIAEEILRAVPGTAMASDQAYREADIAIDFCEDVPALPSSEVARIKALMEAYGLNAKISSIHVNGWFGSYDKFSTTKLLMLERFGIDIDAENSRCVFIGDSPNDAPMFEFFTHSVGVANVHDFVGRIATLPCYVTRARYGEGFVEFSDELLGKASLK